MAYEDLLSGLVELHVLYHAAQEEIFWTMQHAARTDLCMLLEPCTYSSSVVVHGRSMTGYRGGGLTSEENIMSRELERR